ncbi:glutathione S-transferase family protein [Hydrogenophaga sp. YM1]|uniref:glutathione S-transferase family protein n=1 Tax=Hydrogenophaga TaxID=47420 RepID=UPI00086DBBC4|nr:MULTISPECIES: glutathione S-transferase family protein [unclassified Hydrogenophaga]MBN9371827.1 glutathione S-transferase family protein [Hydrogenophaga sp.]ODT32690.1 MAG: glutathione S-transferase [Hydrogenophaga sp. SCN 70-13]OJV45266.1 MAG: glutathione S-transferase [Hydrogenophaga sp. 70-12]QRR34916.1 glutathione S-transferase family protein [Hydrogenophaga sp. YM1]
MPLQLFIGNKNYSSWSMRPWVLMRQAGIPFEEVLIRFDSFEADSVFKQRVKAVNPLGKVPALVDDGFAIWDSLAIAEYLAERFPDQSLWPTDARQRARARSVCAEMHSGFSALRNHCPMNIEASLPETGALLWRDQAGLRADVARLEAMWGELLAAQPGDGLLFGAFSIADAFFAPVCTRIRTYALPVSDVVRAYVDRVLALPGVTAWVDGALKERDFIDFDEPYRLRPAAR